MTNDITIKSIKREFLNSKGYKKTNFICDLHIIKNDGSLKIMRGLEFMETKKLKREAINMANEYKNYLLSKGEFYFI